MGLRYRFAVFAKALDVKLDCLANELLRFVSCFANCDTAWQIGHVRADALACFFEDDEVFHAFSLVFLQASLLQDTSKRPNRYIQVRFTGNSNGAGLHGMPKLSMTAPSAS